MANIEGATSVFKTNRWESIDPCCFGCYGSSNRYEPDLDMENNKQQQACCNSGLKHKKQSLWNLSKCKYGKSESLLVSVC